MWKRGVIQKIPVLWGMRIFLPWITLLFYCVGYAPAVSADGNLAQVVKKPKPMPPEIPKEPLPPSGSVQSFTSAERLAPFEIKAGEGNHYLVKLVGTESNEPVLTVFVRGGTTVNLDVPLGSYEVRYAAGDEWYGYERLFGPKTTYHKADEIFTFEMVENGITGFSITLYSVPGGNLSTSAISQKDF